MTSDPIGWIYGSNYNRRLVWGYDAVGVRMDHLVMLGDTIAVMSEWADALDVSRQQVAARLGSGWTALDALGGEPRYEHDSATRRFILEHPRGAGLAEIGRHIGLSRERARQIQAEALKKARRACFAIGMDAESFLYAIQQRDDRWQGMAIVPENMNTMRARKSARGQHGEAARRLLDALSDGGEWTRRELVRATGLNASSVWLNMDKLTQAGLVESWHAKGRGKALRYRLAAEEEAA